MVVLSATGRDVLWDSPSSVVDSASGIGESSGRQLKSSAGFDSEEYSFCKGAWDVSCPSQLFRRQKRPLS